MKAAREADHPRDVIPPAGRDHHQQAATATLPGDLRMAPVAEGVGRAGGRGRRRWR
jgi:hypothetical protein